MRCAVISAHGSGVLAGGLMAGDVSSDTAYQVTTARGIGSRLPSLTEPVHEAARTQVGNRLHGAHRVTREDVVVSEQRPIHLGRQASVSVADAGVLPSFDGVYLRSGDSPAFTDRVNRVHLS
jgi:hypothetical protein